MEDFPGRTERSRSGRVVAVVRRVALALTAAVVFPHLAAAHVEAMSVPRLAAVSPHVVVAVVEGRASRWNPQHTLIVTDYTLHVEERLRGAAPDRITLTVPGGTLGAVTHETCVTVALEPGARYLLFLADLDHPSFTPVVGAGQGMFREIPDAEGSLAAQGEDGAPLAVHGRLVRFADLVAAVRPLAAKALQASPRPAPAPPIPLPFKTWSLAAPAAGVPVAGVAPLARPEVEGPPLPGNGAPGIVEAAGSSAPAAARPPLPAKFIYFQLAQPPMLVNPLGADSAFSPWDQHEMALWNLYSSGGLFQVIPNPTPDWGFGNGLSDIAGFPPDDQMQVNFGMTWGEIGNDVLGITINDIQNNVITESDVALNPRYSWTTDEVDGRHYFHPYPFQDIILHELGHVWGLHHPVEENTHAWWDSVMHVKDRHYYMEELFADDTNAVRSAFPPGAVLHDGLISSYITQWDDDLNTVDYIPTQPSVSSLRAGRGFTLISPIKIENPGTVPLVHPVVEVYLTPKQATFAGGILIKRLRVGATVPAGGRQVVDVGALRVPNGTPPGTYFIAFFLRDPKDTYQTNNGAWSDDDVTLTVVRH
jgi:hypothetical protein